MSVKDFVNIDCLGQTIEVGDTVAFKPPGSPSLEHGKIIRCTPLGVTINYSTIVKHCNRPNKGVVKINEQLAIVKEKYPENFI